MRYIHRNDPLSSRRTSKPAKPREKEKERQRRQLGSTTIILIEAEGERKRTGQSIRCKYLREPRDRWSLRTPKFRHSPHTRKITKSNADRSRRTARASGTYKLQTRYVIPAGTCEITKSLAISEMTLLSSRIETNGELAEKRTTRRSNRFLDARRGRAG